MLRLQVGDKGGCILLELGDVDARVYTSLRLEVVSVHHLVRAGRDLASAKVAFDAPRAPAGLLYDDALRERQLLSGGSIRGYLDVLYTLGRGVDLIWLTLHLVYTSSTNSAASHSEKCRAPGRFRCGDVTFRLMKKLLAR